VSDKDFFDFGSLKVSFINLDARVDRLQHISKELKNIGLGFASRQPAIKKDNGALGCSLSHLEVISGVNLSDGGLLMVCEDDCQFLVNRSKLGALLIEFQKNPALDVLCLAYNVVGRNSIVPISNLLSVTNNTQTTACYVIKAHMVEPLSKIFSSSSLALESGKPINVYAIDQLWKKLQKTAIFAIPSSRAAQQVESYSDIEGRTVFYGV
jgi:glycosyl transferase family 25